MQVAVVNATKRHRELVAHLDFDALALLQRFHETIRALSFSENRRRLPVPVITL